MKSLESLTGAKSQKDRHRAEDGGLGMLPEALQVLQLDAPPPPSPPVRKDHGTESKPGHCVHHVDLALGSLGSLVLSDVPSVPCVSQSIALRLRVPGGVGTLCFPWGAKG